MQVLILIIRDYARSRSATMRLAFTHLARAALSTFSATFFAQHLLPALLPLCTDRVADVRIAAAPLLPAAKRTIRLPDEVAALEALGTAASSLLTDSDRRVCTAARAMHAQLKAVPVRLASVGVLEMHGASARPECGLACRVCARVYQPGACNPLHSAQWMRLWKRQASGRSTAHGTACVADRVVHACLQSA